MRCIFSWVHISDCHFGHGSTSYGHDQALVLDRLAADIKDVAKRGAVPSPQAIIVTGDIGNSGASLRPDEYDSAHEWFARLVDALGLNLADVLTVPGNHDINRNVAKQDRDVFRLVDSLRRGAPLDDALANETERSRLAAQLQAYRGLVEKHGSPCGGDDGRALYWVDSRDCVGGFTVRIAGMNTTLLCTGPDEGMLQLGTEQLRRSFLPAPDESTVTLALTHHPFDWLKDGSNAEAWTSQYADVHLSGHVHLPSTAGPREGGQPEIVKVTAGAAHGEEGAPPEHSYNFGAIYVDDDDTLVVRAWHRKWARTTFIADLERADDETQGYAEDRQRRRLHPRADASGVEEATLRASRQLLRSLGARRTAYPTDLTISELDSRHVLVMPRLVGLLGRKDTVDVHGLADGLEAGGSALVLGEPGAGKTVLVYLLHQELFRRGRLPLSLSIADLVGLPELTLDDLQKAVVRHLPMGSTVDFARDELVYLVDGLDEAVAAGSSLRDIARVLDWLPQIGTVLATCRVREFEDHLVGRMNLDRFEQMTLLADWTDADFAEFVTKLEAAHLFESTAVLEVVRRSPALQHLVRRPLFARMLTFIFPKERSAISDVAGLYAAYLRHLARAVETRMRRTGCTPENAYGLWQVTSWHVFATRAFHQELLPAAVPGAYLVTTQGLSPSCAQTVVHGLLDFTQFGTELQARYRHYSFFEFLVADHVATTLVERAMRGESTCWDLLALDLPREMRRHLTRILAQSTPLPVIGLLLDQFARLKEDVPDETTRRVVGNLSAYILGRIGATPTELHALLNGEEDNFLRTSLYWALANVDDRDATSSYATLLQEDPDMASLNRGYLLYYWGDIDREQPPPYRDDVSGADWSQTRSRTLELMAADDYASRESLSRRTLDLMTFLDFANFHRTPLASDEAEVVLQRLQQLADSKQLQGPAAGIAREVLGST